MQITESIFFVAFMSQIFLLSFYLPRKMQSRTRCFFNEYPPERFPHLYPRKIEYYKRYLRYFMNLNHFILLAGLGLWVLHIMDPSYKPGDGGVVFPYFMLQNVPLILAEIWTFKSWKELRTADKRTKKTASLVRRRFIDYLPPRAIATVALVYIAFVAFVGYINQFELEWFGGYMNVYILTGMNLWFLAILCWNIYGKKQNPHQSEEERGNQTRLVARQLVAISVLATVFLALTVALRFFDTRFLMPTAMSLYFQILTLTVLWMMKQQTFEFEEYKDDTVATQLNGQREG